MGSRSRRSRYRPDCSSGRRRAGRTGSKWSARRDGRLIDLGRREEVDWTADSEHAGAVAALPPQQCSRSQQAPPQQDCVARSQHPSLQQAWLSEHVWPVVTFSQCPFLQVPPHLPVLDVSQCWPFLDCRRRRTHLRCRILAGITGQATLFHRGRAGPRVVAADRAAGATPNLIGTGLRARIALTTELIVDANRGTWAALTAAALLRGRIAAGVAAAIVEAAGVVSTAMLAGTAFVLGDAFAGGAALLAPGTAGDAVVGAVRHALAALALFAGVAVLLACCPGTGAAGPAAFAFERRGDLAGHGGGFTETARSAGGGITDAMTVEADPAFPAPGPVRDRCRHAALDFEAGMDRCLGAAAERAEHHGDRAGERGLMSERRDVVANVRAS